MKFITTKENKIFKSGIEFEFHSAGIESYHKNKNEILLINADKKPSWTKNKYFKEAEEKEFTKSDMIEFTDYSLSHKGIRFISTDLKDWLKQRIA